MLFKLKADFTFIAHDIDDAFVELASHFLKMNLGDESNLVASGEIKVEKIADDSMGYLDREIK